MLVSPDFSKQFKVYCDASKLGGAMGAVLEEHGIVIYNNNEQLNLLNFF